MSARLSKTLDLLNNSINTTKKLSERWKKQNPTPAPTVDDNTSNANETKPETTSAQAATVNTTNDEANNTTNNNSTSQEITIPVAEEIIEKTIAPTKYYTCRVCRTRLFDDTEMVDHVPGEGQQSFDWNKTSVSDTCQSNNTLAR
jgi:hypothetical protein